MVKNSLYFLLCYAVSVVVSYAGTIAGIDFENSNLRCENVTPEYGLDDDGAYDGDTYWFFEGDSMCTNLCVIRSYLDTEKRYGGYDEEKNPCPTWQHEADDNYGLLSVDTQSGTLLRTFGKVKSASGISEHKAITSSGLYFDGQVQLFSFVDSAPSPASLAAAGNKIAFCISDGSDGKTNLIVTAGSVETDGSLTPTNFMTTLKVKSGEWHRLTVKAVANVATRGERQYVGFMVFWDGQPVKCDAGDYSIGAGANRFDGNAEYANCALFPSMQITGDGDLRAKRLYAVGGCGTLAMDELALTEENPFGKATNQLETVIVCDDEALKSCTIKVTDAGGEELEPLKLEGAFSGTIITNYPGDTVTLVPEVNENYTLGSKLKVSGNAAASLVKKSPYYTVKFADAFTDSSRVTLSISTLKSSYRFNGNEYATFSEIVDLALLGEGNGGTVELVQDVTLDADAAADNGQVWVKPGVSLKLDLCGKALKGTHYREEAAVYAQGGLTIFDSVGGGTITAPGAAIEVALANDALELNYDSAQLQLGEEGVVTMFFVTGVVRRTAGQLSILGGQYANPGGIATNEFYLKDYVLNDGRYSYAAVDDDRAYRVENLGNRHVVRFEATHGEVKPQSSMVIDDGAAIGKMAVWVDAPGYTNVWYNGEVVFDLDEPVLSNLTLVAAQFAPTYTIKYFDGGEESSQVPVSYSVESTHRTLPTLARKRKVFLGWRDRASGQIVKEVGTGAVFVDTEIAVNGDLVLDAEWKAEEYEWANDEAGLAESNGVYSGSWTFGIPSSTDFPAGTLLKIKEIDFCVVNPVTYPKTAPYLMVLTNGASEAVYSQCWDEKGYLDENDEYQVTDGRRLANRRPHVAYKFDNLKVRSGKTGTLRFAADLTGANTNGFLRLVEMESTASGVIGNCLEKEGYEGYRPVYRVKAESCDD